jgi:LL-H family phage holin
MSDIIFEILKLVVMVSILLVTRYLVPLISAHVDMTKVNIVATWAKSAVLKAQQVMSAKSGEERKAFVTEFLKKILTAKNISISDEQIDTLIEAAVKQMKIDENAGIH